MGHTLSEYDSKKLLAKFGIAVPDERLAQSAEQAAAAARARLSVRSVPILIYRKTARNGACRP